MTADRTSAEITDAFARLDSTEQMIFMAGLRGLVLGTFDVAGFDSWTWERVCRHRSGNELALSDLDLPNGDQVQP